MITRLFSYLSAIVVMVAVLAPAGAAFAQNVPEFTAASYLGGNREDRAHGVAVDGRGAIYITGETRSPDFWVSANAFQPQYDGFFLDGFVTKIDTDGNTVIYSSYLGGTDFDVATDIVVAADGSAYVVGYTASSDFPTSDNAAQPDFGGKGNSALTGDYGDAFITRISPDGTTITASTFLGGASVDRAMAVELDDAGNVVVVGYTDSADFPTAGPQLDAGQGEYNGFVAVLNADLTQLVFSTPFGGSGVDKAFGLAVASDRIYVVGETNSENFVTENPVKEQLSGGSDGFWLSLDSSYQLVRASYFGGDWRDNLMQVAVDTNGRLIVAGESQSTTLPGVLGHYQPAPAGNADAFVSVFGDADGDSVITTFLGTGRGELVSSLGVDMAGRIVVAGTTGSGNDFPHASVSGDALQTGDSDLNDGFVAMFESDLSELIYASPLGGEWGEGVNDLAVEPAGRVVIVGEVGSEDMYTSPDPIQQELATNPDGFFWRISAPPIAGLPVTAFWPQEVGRGEVTVMLEGPGLAAATAISLEKGNERYDADRVVFSENGAQAECQFLLHEASLGSYDLVTWRGEVDERLEGVFEVVATKQPKLQLNLIAPRRVRLGAPEYMTVTVTNTGNIDTFGAFLALGFPGDAEVEPAFEWADLVVEGEDMMEFFPERRFGEFEGLNAVPMHLARVGAGAHLSLRFFVTRHTSGYRKTYGSIWSFPVEWFDPLLESDFKDGVSGHIADCKESVMMAEATAINIGIPANCVWGAMRQEIVEERMRASRDLKHKPMGAYDMLVNAGSTCGAERAGVGGAFAAKSILEAVNTAIKECVLDDTQDDELDDQFGFGDGSSNKGGGLFSGLFGGEDDDAEHDQNGQEAVDPNEIVGLAGHGENHAIARGAELSFEIRFENKAEAGLPAQVVAIAQTLDPALYDLDTLIIDEVRVGRQAQSFLLSVEAGLLTIPLADGLAIHFDYSLAANGDLRFELATYDAATGEPTVNNLAGFLPPNQTAPEGQGSILYRISLRADVAANTLIPAQAVIIFDTNEPIVTNIWNHVIDEAAPVTTVDAVADPYSGAELTLTWSSDDGLGAGARFYDVYLAADGGELKLAKRVEETSLTISTEAIESLEAKIVAVDWLENFEEKAASDVAVTIAEDDGENPDGDAADGDGAALSGDDGGCGGCQSGAGPADHPLASAVALMLAGLALAWRSRRMRRFWVRDK